jgi:hypothetical protein
VSDKTRRDAMRFCWAIKVPPSDWGRIPKKASFFGRGAEVDTGLMPLGVPKLFRTEAAARAFLREYVNRHRGIDDCRVVRVQVTESVVEVDAFPKEPFLRESADGRFFPPRKKRNA